MKTALVLNGELLSHLEALARARKRTLSQTAEQVLRSALEKPAPGEIVDPDIITPREMRHTISEILRT